MNRKETANRAYEIGVAEARAKEGIVPAAHSAAMMELIEESESTADTIYFIKAYNHGVADEISRQTRAFFSAEQKTGESRDSEEEKEMKKFEVGKSYRNTFTGNVITVTKRTPQFIFVTMVDRDGVDCANGLVSRFKIRANSKGDEHITTPAKYMYFASDEVTAEQTAPEAAAMTPDEPEAEAVTQETAPETEAAQEAEAADTPEAETPVSETEAPAKAAAMTAQESTARKMIAEQTTEYLLNTWEGTTTNNDPFIPTVRGWLMDELRSRYPEAYDKWLDSETCEDAALREYINAAIQAEQDAAKAPQEAGEATDVQAPDADDVREYMAIVRSVGENCLNRAKDERDCAWAATARREIDWYLSEAERDGVALEVEYDANGRFADVRERKSEADSATPGQSAPATDRKDGKKNETVRNQSDPRPRETL